MALSFPTPLVVKHLSCIGLPRGSKGILYVSPSTLGQRQGKKEKDRKDERSKVQKVRKDMLVQSKQSTVNSQTAIGREYGGLWVRGMG